MSKFLDMDGLAYYTNKFKPALANIVDNFQKNFIKVAFTSIAATSTTPSIINNGDGSVTINGSNTSGFVVIVRDISSDVTASPDTRYTLPVGNYVLKNTENENIFTQVYMHDGTATNFIQIAQESVSDVKFTYSAENKLAYPYICCRLYIKSSSTFNNYTIYPMLCTQFDWEVSQTYVPYHKNIASNSEIIQMWENS